MVGGVEGRAVRKRIWPGIMGPQFTFSDQGQGFSFKGNIMIGLFRIKI